MTKMLPIPNIDNEKFPHTRPGQSKREHTKLYTFSSSDYPNLNRHGGTDKQTGQESGARARALNFGQHGHDGGRRDTQLWQAGPIGRRNIVVLHQCDLKAG
jgi:hypothetical protein